MKLSQDQLQKMLAGGKVSIDGSMPKPKPLREAAAPVVDVAVSESTIEAGLNKNEREFLAWLRQQDFQAIYVQEITLILGHDLRLTPDFFVITKDGKPAFYDTKHRRFSKGGTKRLFVEEDAKVKFKVAARQHRWASFHYVSKNSAGVWEFEEVKP